MIHPIFGRTLLGGNNKMKYAHTESDRDRDFWQKGIVL